MPKGRRIIKTGTYRKRRRQMRTRRIRRESVYWAAGAVLALLVAWGLVTAGSAAWRGVARWWQTRQVAASGVDLNRPVTVAVVAVDSRKSLKVATALGVVQFVPKEKKVRGITFPGNTFVEVPGQGFERAAEALRAGPDVAMATVQNLLGVPVDRYVIIDGPEYRSLTEDGLASAVFFHPVATDVPADQRARLTKLAEAVKAGDALMVPLPVHTIAVGQDIYYEAQKAQVADVLKAWWGVSETPEKQPLRIKILNGVGTPGIGGVAAGPLIKAGFRVVDTANADRFTYKKTLIVVYHADPQQTEQIRKLLGTGAIVHGTMDQGVVDVIVIIGKDYRR